MNTKKKVILYLLLTAGAALMLSPLLWMVSTSLKDPADVMKMPPEWIPDPVRIENFTEVGSLASVLGSKKQVPSMKSIYRRRFHWRPSQASSTSFTLGSFTRALPTDPIQSALRWSCASPLPVMRSIRISTTST